MGQRRRELEVEETWQELKDAAQAALEKQRRILGERGSLEDRGLPSSTSASQEIAPPAARKELEELRREVRLKADAAVVLARRCHAAEATVANTTETENAAAELVTLRKRIASER